MDAVYEKFQNGGKINGIPLVLLSIKFFFLVYESIYKSLELFDLEEEEEFRLLVYIQSYQILFFFLFICIAKYSNLSYTCNYSSVDWCDAWE